MPHIDLKLPQDPPAIVAPIDREAGPSFGESGFSGMEYRVVGMESGAASSADAMTFELPPQSASESRPAQSTSAAAAAQEQPRQSTAQTQQAPTAPSQATAPQTAPAPGPNSQPAPPAQDPAAAPFDAAKAAADLQNSFSSWHTEFPIFRWQLIKGCDVESVKKILTGLAPEQLSQLRSEYEKRTGLKLDNTIAVYMTPADQAVIDPLLYPNDPITPAAVRCKREMDYGFEEPETLAAQFDGRSIAERDQIRVRFKETTGALLDERIFTETSSDDLKKVMEVLLRDDSLGKKALELRGIMDYTDSNKVYKWIADDPRSMDVALNEMSAEEVQKMRVMLLERHGIHLDRWLASSSLDEEVRTKSFAKLHHGDPIGPRALEAFQTIDYWNSSFVTHWFSSTKPMEQVLAGTTPPQIGALREQLKTHYDIQIDRELAKSTFIEEEERQKLYEMMYKEDPVGAAAFRIARCDPSLVKPADRAASQQKLGAEILNFKGNPALLRERLSTDYGIDAVEVVRKNVPAGQLRDTALAIISTPSAAPSGPGANPAARQPAPPAQEIEKTAAWMHDQLAAIRDAHEAGNREVKEALKKSVLTMLQQVDTAKLEEAYMDRFNSDLRDELSVDFSTFGDTARKMLDGVKGGVQTLDLDALVLRGDFRTLHKALSEMDPAERTAAITAYDQANLHHIGPVIYQPVHNSPFMYSLSVSFSPQQYRALEKVIYGK